MGNLPEIMRHINGAYTTYFNTKRARSGHLFQGHSKAILVEVDEYAKELSRYIHLNPDAPEWVRVQKNTVGRVTSVTLERTNRLSGCIGISFWTILPPQSPWRKKDTEGFVNELIGIEYKSPLGGVVSATLLGSESFVDLIKVKYVYGKKPDKEIPALKELADRPSVEQISALVDTVSWKDGGLSRGIIMYLCRQYSGARLKEIGAFFGIGESAVSQASRRIEEKMKSSRALEREMKAAENELFLSRMKTPLF